MSIMLLLVYVYVTLLYMYECRMYLQYVCMYVCTVALEKFIIGNFHVKKVHR